MMRLRPGSSAPWKRPRRSTTQALCCGTMRTPSITNAITTPRTRIQNQYLDSAGTNEAATAAATATASFQNIDPLPFRLMPGDSSLRRSVLPSVAST